MKTLSSWSRGRRWSIGCLGSSGAIYCAQVKGGKDSEYEIWIAEWRTKAYPPSVGLRSYVGELCLLFLIGLRATSESVDHPEHFCVEGYQFTIKLFSKPYITGIVCCKAGLFG